MASRRLRRELIGKQRVNFYHLEGHSGPLRKNCSPLTLRELLNLRLLGGGDRQNSGISPVWVGAPSAALAAFHSNVSAASESSTGTHADLRWVRAPARSKT